MRILVVEDNAKLASAIQAGLAEQGHSVDVVLTGGEGEEAAAAEPYDLVILDVMLPDRDGVEVCRTLRHHTVTTPILLLTALSRSANVVAGLDAGADDYLTKPFDFDVLLARVRALLRRGQASEAVRLTYGDVVLDLGQRVAEREGETIKLSSKEFALLEYLMRNADRVVTRTSIAQKVWGMNYEPTSNVIDVYISTLRKKLDKGYERPLIHTIIGTGYRFGATDGSALAGE